MTRDGAHEAMRRVKELARAMLDVADDVERAVDLLFDSEEPPKRVSLDEQIKWQRSRVEVSTNKPSDEAVYLTLYVMREKIVPKLRSLCESDMIVGFGNCNEILREIGAE